MIKIKIKYLLLFVNLMLILNHSFSQTWTEHTAINDTIYKYEYWFQFDNTDNENSYTIDKNFGKDFTEISVFNNYGDTLSLSNIVIINKLTGERKGQISDFNGLCFLNLNNGKYQIEVNVLGYDKFLLDFEIINNEPINLKITLGLAPELQVYQICSKNILKEKTIKKIIKCVKENRKTNIKKCERKNEYIISIQI